MALFSRLSDISRRQKLELFNCLIKPTENLRILDVGGQVEASGAEGLQFIDSYPWKNSISAINLSAEHIASIKEHYPELEAVLGDACQMPWPDQHFDVAYCNAVIEHLPSLEKQQKMAAEIMRVAKRWFVTTPNRWYPFEFHMRLPLVTWLPGNAYLMAGRCIAYNHVKKRYTFYNKPIELRLISARELRQCFPDSRIIRQRVTFMAETLIAVGGNINLNIRQNP